MRNLEQKTDFHQANELLWLTDLNFWWQKLGNGLQSFKSPHAKHMRDDLKQCKQITNICYSQLPTVSMDFFTSEL